MDCFCYRPVIQTEGNASMKVFVTGATGVLGRSAVAALLEDGHEVSGIARDEPKARGLETMGATAVRQASLLDQDALACALEGFDAVCNLVTHVPVGTAAIRPGAWKTNDQLRSKGSSVVAQAARDSGVRTLVQESVSLMYADGGDSWITEKSTLAVTRATDPAAVAEDNASRFDSASRTTVILRFGLLVGKDPITRWLLNRARGGRPITLGAPGAWAHLVHPHDAGTAVAAALAAPGGVYNVGADPVRRCDMNQVFAGAVGRESLRHVSRLMVRLGGERVAPMTRSHRVSSAKLHEVTGWKPAYHAFDSSWLTTQTDHQGTSEDSAATSPRRSVPVAGRPGKPPDRRLLDDVFGDVLPDSTRDERSDSAEQGRDDELLRDVPPHHG